MLAIILLSGCGERERTIDDVPFTPPISADTANVVPNTQVEVDTLPSLDTLAGEDPVVLDAFSVFLRDFQAAVRTGDPAALSSLVAFREGGLDAAGFNDRIYPSVFQGEMRDPLLKAVPSDFERRGPQRVITLHVGYDREGNVVPPEEAYTEAAATLTFDDSPDGYRLVRVDVR